MVISKAVVLNKQSFYTARTFFFFAVLLVVAKPFLGFTMFNRTHPPAADNIFIKAFDKRKQEYNEDSTSNVDTIQKKLTNPKKWQLLRISCLLNILFPFSFKTISSFTTGFLRDLQLKLPLSEDTWLLNSSFLI